MRLVIVCAGKVREKWLREGIAEYIKRLSRFCEIKMIEVPDAPDSLPREQALEQEGNAMLAKIKPSSNVWLMDVAGECLNSEEYSKLLIRGFEDGGAELVFVIGGSNGFSTDLIKRANRRICFSEMTFTHCMARLILLEQCYRAFKIARGEKYHK
jgi:23S rRNA (pseudouridine1915-N3)-methyltransferase